MGAVNSDHTFLDFSRRLLSRPPVALDGTSQTSGVVAFTQMCLALPPGGCSCPVTSGGDGQVPFSVRSLADKGTEGNLIKRMLVTGWRGSLHVHHLVTLSKGYL